MLFHFFNFSQCVVCVFGHKTILQSFKSPKGDISFKKKIPFQ